MITYHLIDSITLMNAIEIIEKSRWNDVTTKQQNNQNEDSSLSAVLTALRNAARNAPLPIEAAQGEINV